MSYHNTHDNRSVVELVRSKRNLPQSRYGLTQVALTHPVVISEGDVRVAEAAQFLLHVAGRGAATVLPAHRASLRA